MVGSQPSNASCVPSRFVGSRESLNFKARNGRNGLVGRSSRGSRLPIFAFQMKKNTSEFPPVRKKVSGTIGQDRGSQLLIRSYQSSTKARRNRPVPISRHPVQPWMTNIIQYSHLTNQLWRSVPYMRAYSGSYMDRGNDGALTRSNSQRRDHFWYEDLGPDMGSCALQIGAWQEGFPHVERVV